MGFVDHRRALGFTFTALPSSFSTPTAPSTGTSLSTPAFVSDLQGLASAIRNGQSIVSQAQAIVNPNSSLDTQRKARAQYFLQSALAGSVTAARYLLGGLTNTASHEQPYYQSAIAQLQNDPLGAQVYAEAQQQGAKWIQGDTGPGSATSQQMYNDVKQDLLALGKTSYSQPTSVTQYLQAINAPTGAPIVPTSSTSPTSPTVRALPPMTSTGSYNWIPAAIAGGLGLAAVAALSSRPRRRTRARRR